MIFLKFREIEFISKKMTKLFSKERLRIVGMQYQALKLLSDVSQEMYKITHATSRNGQNNKYKQGKEEGEMQCFIIVKKFIYNISEVGLEILYYEICRIISIKSNFKRNFLKSLFTLYYMYVCMYIRMSVCTQFVDRQKHTYTNICDTFISFRNLQLLSPKY